MQNNWSDYSVLKCTYIFEKFCKFVTRRHSNFETSRDKKTVQLLIYEIWPILLYIYLETLQLIQPYPRPLLEAYRKLLFRNLLVPVSNLCRLRGKVNLGNKKVSRGQIRQVLELRKVCHDFFCESHTSNKQQISGSIVVVQHPFITGPKFTSLPSNIVTFHLVERINDKPFPCNQRK